MYVRLLPKTIAIAIKFMWRLPKSANVLQTDHFLTDQAVLVVISLAFGVKILANASNAHQVNIFHYQLVSAKNANLTNFQTQ